MAIRIDDVNPAGVYFTQGVVWRRPGRGGAAAWLAGGGRGSAVRAPCATPVGARKTTREGLGLAGRLSTGPLVGF